MVRTRPLQAALLATPDETEAQFYEALQLGDIERMVALWCDEDEVACVHPQGQRLVGMHAIRTAFEEMFAQGGSDLRPVHVRRFVSGGMAVHHVVEELRVLTGEGVHRAYVQATNVYVKTPQGWRMIVHHASPAESLDVHGNGDAPSTLH